MMEKYCNQAFTKKGAHRVARGLRKTGRFLKVEVRSEERLAIAVGTEIRRSFVWVEKREVK